MRSPTPMAAKVPRGIARVGSSRSPDMFTPAMMPVTAGKKTAKTVQKGTGVWLASNAISAGVASTGFPKRRERRERVMAPMTKYWARMATRAEVRARAATKTVVTTPTTFTFREGNTPTMLSANPTV